MVILQITQLIGKIIATIRFQSSANGIIFLFRKVESCIVSVNMTFVTLSAYCCYF